MKIFKKVDLNGINFKKLNGSLLLVFYVVFCFLPHNPGSLAQAILYPLALAVFLLVGLYLSIIFIAFFGSLTVEFGYGIWLLIKPAFLAYWNWIKD